VKLWPDGVWFGLTKPRLRVAAWTLGALFGVVLVFCGGAVLFIHEECQRAESLLNQLSKVSLGDDEAAVRSLLKEYEDVWHERQSPARGDSTLLVDPWHFYHPLIRPQRIDFPLREAIYELGRLSTKLGLRPWVVDGGLRSKDGRVEGVWAEVLVEGKSEMLMANWSYVHDVPIDRLNLERDANTFRPEMGQFYVYWTHLHFGDQLGEGMRSSITPMATLEEQRAARSINLRCLTSISGCASLCDLMPELASFSERHDYPGLLCIRKDSAP